VTNARTGELSFFFTTRLAAPAASGAPPHSQGDRMRIAGGPTLAVAGGGGYFIRFGGVPGTAYRLQCASDLTGP
jgi:hypothetical protein